MSNWLRDRYIIWLDKQITKTEESIVRLRKLLKVYKRSLQKQWDNIDIGDRFRLGTEMGYIPPESNDSKTNNLRNWKKIMRGK